MENNPLIQDFLNQKIWAVVGASTNTDKYGYKVYAKLKESNYIVMPVNPNIESIEGDRCYPTIESLPQRPDVVSVIVPPNVTEDIIYNCIKAEVQKVWMQPGADSPEAIRVAENNGLQVIHHRCVLIELKKRRESN